MSVESNNSPAAQKLIETGALALEHAKKLGADEADLVASRSTDFEVKVADGEIVTLTQAVSKGLGLRVFVDGQLGFCRTSDFGKQSIEHAVTRAVQMARQTARDPHNGLPEIETTSITAGPELDLYDPRIPELTTEEKIRWAHELESAARESDPRVTKFRDSGVASGESEWVLLTSRGATRSLRSTGIAVWCNPLAEADGEMQTEFWYDSKSHLEDLEAIDLVGRTAGQRAARMLGAKPVKTQNAAVIFEPGTAAGLLAGMLGGLDGDMIHKKASFLVGKLDSQIAVEGLSIIDDPLLVRGTGSAPFDGEGLQTYRKAIIDKGRLTTFLYDSYTARKAGAKPTANGRRGFASPPSAGPFNFFAEAGTDDPAEIIASADKALIITRGLGRGLNTVSGEYSRGANGLWVEKGEIVHPVQEVTIAGDYLNMLSSLDRIGNDLRMAGSTGAPTLRVAEMTVSGR